MQIKEAIILAGGLGTRLRAAVPDLPKCMAPINGRPFISYVINHFLKEGIQKIILALGYKSEAIIDYTKKQYPNLQISYSTETSALGTGGAIRLACKHTSEKIVLALNGDTLFNINVQQLSEFQEVQQADCVLSLKPMQQFSRYGVVTLKNDNSISSFKEKQYYEEGLINGGVYALNAPAFLSEDLPAEFSFEKDYLEKKFRERRMFGLVQDSYFIDIGILEDFEKANKELRNIQ